MRDVHSLNVLSVRCNAVECSFSGFTVYLHLDGLGLCTVVAHYVDAVGWSAVFTASLRENVGLRTRI